MRRTTISLPDELADALDREARRRSLPASAIARNALSDYLGIGRPDQPRALPFAAIGRGGERTIGRDMEQLLVREWTPDARRR